VTLRTRLALALVALTAVGLGVAAIVTYHEVGSFLVKRVDQELASAAENGSLFFPNFDRGTTTNNGVPPGTYAEYVKLASIKETSGQPPAEEMVRLLVEGNEAVVRTARSIFPEVDKAHDEPTADLLTQRMQVHEKNAWMLRSLLE